MFQWRRTFFSSIEPLPLGGDGQGEEDREVYPEGVSAKEEWEQEEKIIHKMVGARAQKREQEERARARRVGSRNDADVAS